MTSAISGGSASESDGAAFGGRAGGAAGWGVCWSAWRDLLVVLVAYPDLRQVPVLALTLGPSSPLGPWTIRRRFHSPPPAELRTTSSPGRRREPADAYRS